MDESELKLIWEESKNKLDNMHQKQIEMILNTKNSYKVCWSCGNEKDLILICFKMGEMEVRGVMCNDCLKAHMDWTDFPITIERQL